MILSERKITRTSPRLTDSILQRLTTLHPKLIDLGLHRTERLLSALGHPERLLPPVIHVAGTNGKGSTIAFMHAIARAAGLTAHVYTSPHLVRFNERILLNGIPIDDLTLLSTLEECEIVNDGAPITFFEITTAAAFLAFSRRPADLLLLETGLGGRFDSTNVLKAPAVTVITPVSLDHMDFLGDTIAKIAFQKSGILKPSVPCIVAPQEPSALEVIEARAKEIGTPLSTFGVNWTSGPIAKGMFYSDGDGEFHLPKIGLAGTHQSHNAGAAIATLRCWRSKLFNFSEVSEGVSSSSWPGRLQRLTSGKFVEGLPDGWELWLDGGHNPAAGTVLADTVGSWSRVPLVLICAMQINKDLEGFLRPLKEYADRLIAINLPSTTEGYQPATLAAVAKAVGLESTTASSASDAILTAVNGPKGRILVCGSLYLIGEFLATTFPAD